MRPIVSFCESPTHQLSKYLTNILQPLTDKSRRKLQSTKNFIDAIKTVQIPDDYKLVSFDVKSLFTSIPLQLALQSTEIAIQQLPLPTEPSRTYSTLPLWLRYVGDTFTAVRNDEIDAFLDQKRRHPVYQRNRRKWKTSFFRLFGNKITNYERLCTENRRIPTDYSTNPTSPRHGHDYKDFDETSATSV